MTAGGSDGTISALEATPRWLSGALASCSPDRIEASDRPGEWNLAEIIGHLRASDAILAPRILQILIRPGVALAAFDERALAEVLARARIPLADQLAEFTIGRRELIGVLRSLSGDQWQLSGAHELRGTMTIAEIAASIVDHEAEHRAQLESLEADS